MKIKKKKIFDKTGKILSSTMWNIEIDYNNLEDLKNLGNKIKAQINSLNSIQNGTKKELQSKRFNDCSIIYATDISELYKELQLDNRPIYYVYAHCLHNKIIAGKDGITSWLGTLGLNNMPFYIGKGTGNRAYDTNRNETHRKVKQKLQAFNQDIKVHIIQDGLTELEALCLESKLIDILGILGKGGKLVNLDEGVKSKERQEIYQSHLYDLNNFYKEMCQNKIK